jgi:hypothetical protein
MENDGYGSIIPLTMGTVHVFVGTVLRPPTCRVSRAQSLFIFL